VRLRPEPRARSQKAGEQRFKEVLQYSLSCISQTVWVTTPSLRGPRGTMLLTTRETPIRLRTRDGADLYLTAGLDFQFVERDDWHCTTLAYTYTLYSPELVEVMSWQWRRGSPQLPHLHVRADMPALGGAIRKLHLPTGRVAFEEIVAFLINDLDVVTRMDDWRERVDEALYYFLTYRTWPGSQRPPAG
jgi:hypothetical protein